MTNYEWRMRGFDLEGRTSKFSLATIKCLRGFPKNVIDTPIISQLVRSATSIGANYREANNYESKNDFIHKIALCRKESRETQYWLELLLDTHPDKDEELKILLKEADELNLIFSRIIITSKSSNK